MALATVYFMLFYACARQHCYGYFDVHAVLFVMFVTTILFYISPLMCDSNNIFCIIWLHLKKWTKLKSSTHAASFFNPNNNQHCVFILCMLGRHIFFYHKLLYIYQVIYQCFYNTPTPCFTAHFFKQNIMARLAPWMQ